jgi:DNA-directed RNA polymerase specialized sigma24 family protein
MRSQRARTRRTPPGAMTWRPADAEDVSRTVAALYQEHYLSLVRLAVLLVSDLTAAEEIVQEAFADLHGTWRTLPGPDAGLRYLRRSLIRRSRATASQQAGAAAGLGAGAAAGAGAVPGAGAAAGAGAGLLPALRALPARQREVLVLRYFADLPEAEIAAVTGTRIAVVRTYATRGMSSLRAGLPGNVA